MSYNGADELARELAKGLDEADGYFAHICPVEKPGAPLYCS